MDAQNNRIVEMSDHEERQGPSDAPPTDEETAADDHGSTKTRKHKLSSAKKLEKMQQEHERRGVVYLSRLPPHIVSGMFFCIPQISSVPSSPDHFPLLTRRILKS